MEPIEDSAAIVIEKSRKLTRSLASKIVNKGVEPADVAIGISYALHDIATEIHQNPVAAIEWMRSATDIMERSFLEGNSADKTTSH